jgi:nucleotide-binding universal stress UspA family protein
MEERGIEGWGLEEATEHAIDRILVALDPSLHSRAALEAAAAMAARFEAELMALFIEDANIRRLTELPFVQEVGFYTGSCRSVESRELSRQLRVQAGRMRRRFTLVTRHIETRCSFQEIRGRVAPEVLKAAAEVDVAILGKGAWSAVDTGRLAPDVREILSQAPASTLVLQAETVVEPPVRVVYTDTPLAHKALSIAVRLAEDGHLMVFVLADDAEKASRLYEEAEQAVEGRQIDLSFQTLTEASVSRLAYLMAHEGEGTLVLPADAHRMEEEALLDFLDETGAPVLMVR